MTLGDLIKTYRQMNVLQDKAVTIMLEELLPALTPQQRRSLHMSITRRIHLTQRDAGKHFQTLTRITNDE